jgi:hypothetical protein
VENDVLNCDREANPLEDRILIFPSFARFQGRIAESVSGLTLDSPAVSFNNLGSQHPVFYKSNRIAIAGNIKNITVEVIKLALI